MVLLLGAMWKHVTQSQCLGWQQGEEQGTGGSCRRDEQCGFGFEVLDKALNNI